MSSSRGKKRQFVPHTNALDKKTKTVKSPRKRRYVGLYGGRRHDGSMPAKARRLERTANRASHTLNGKGE